FCSKSCQTRWRNTEYKGEKHLMWKGGLNIDYRKIIINSDFVEMCGLCGCEDKRILVVHHIDKNRKNCNITNLAWLCHNCHHLVHFDKAKQEEFLLKRKNMATIV
ncbi:MAG: HNH endonuclease signature motif containing protein, partial [Candidatus Paceibacterota bacterium]